MKKIASSENIENFSLNDYIYIDKTEYIYNLIENNERVFFSRPRRFGKSLTLNTIGTLFEKGVDPYFKGTWIYDKWQQDKYPVLHLSFLKFSVTDFEEFKRDFNNELYKFIKALSITDVIDNDKPNVLLGNMLSALGDGQQIVLLFDEYDCQLSANINNPELYEKFRTLIREIYAVLKGEKHIKFLAVTGVTRLKDVSIFSVGSDIIDLTYDHAYSQMIGFTRSEIKKFYIDYLRLGVGYEKGKASDTVTDTEIDEFLDRMAEHYDGYCFDEFYKNKVFSTYSVNNFLRSLSQKQCSVFGDYWYEAGGVPSILNNYLQSHEINLEKFQDSEISISYDAFMNPTTLPTMDENVLMCQTGYLTLKSAINPDSFSVGLGLANKEVRKALSKLLAFRLISEKFLVQQASKINISSCTADELIEHFNSLLAAVSYDKYPVKNEAMLRALLQFYLIGRGLDVRVEQNNSKGRSDIIVNFEKRRLVIELKYSKDGRDTDALMKEAINQINANEYGTENLDCRELLKIACVFDASEDKRKITVFQTVE